MKGEHIMKKVEINMSSIKKSLLVGALALTMGGLTGCSTDDKKPEDNPSNNIVEEEIPANKDFEQMTDEETSVLQVGDVIEKEADRAILEKKGLDYVYVYDTEIEGEKYESVAVHEYEGKVHNSTTTTGKKTVYTFSHMEIVEIYYENSKETGKLMKKMKWQRRTIEAEPIYPELAKEKINTK